MKKICVLVSVFLCVLLAAANAESAINPGSYDLKNDYMEGDFDLRQTDGKYEASISLVQPESGHLAWLEGPAVIIGNRILITSTEDDEAAILITIGEDAAIIEANEAAERLYSGMRAVFSGTYDLAVTR